MFTPLFLQSIVARAVTIQGAEFDQVKYSIRWIINLVWVDWTANKHLVNAD